MLPYFRQRSSSEDAPHLDFLASVSDMILPGDVLPDWFMFVLQAGAGARLDDLEVDLVTQLVLVPEVGGSRAGVEEVIAVVFPGDVREVEIALDINSQSRGVDGFQGPIETLKQRNQLWREVESDSNKQREAAV